MKKFWIGSIVGLGIIDWYRANIKHSGTLSQCGRETFRTDTTLGKAAWVTAWAVLTSWLIPHIWKWPKELIDEIS